MLAGSSLESKSIPTGSNGCLTAPSATRRKSAEEISGHRQPGSLLRKPCCPVSLALRDVVLFWIDRGVRIFRVDNPHTKPLPFWEWLIADLKERDPGVVFLSEAFTRPKLMKAPG